MSTSLPTNKSRGSSLLVGQWITVSVASLLIFLRIYTRAFHRKIAGADDWTIVIALGFAIAQAILTTFQVGHGFGRHIQYVPPEQISNVLLITTIKKVTHTIGTFFVRVSVCLFVLRLAPPEHREYHRYTYIIIAVFAIISTATCLLILLGCIPTRGTWDPNVQARCIPRSDLTIIAKTQGAASAVMDLLCVVLPIFFLRNLQAKIGRKISLFVLLGLGLFTAVCATLRTLDINFAIEDFTWHNVPMSFWAFLEQNIGIIIASIPAVHHLYNHMLQKFFPDFGKSYPILRSLNLYTSSGNTSRSSASHHNEKMWADGRGGSQSAGVMSSAGGGATILPGPPSPTKKEPRLDYDSATLESSPKLGRADALEDEFSYLNK